MKTRLLIKTMVNKLLRPIGLKVTRIFDGKAQERLVQNEAAVSNEMVVINNNLLAFDKIYSLRTTMEHLLAHCKMLGLSPSTVIDVGVAYGTPALYSVFADSKHLLMEPIKEYEPALKKICKKVNAQYVLAAASSKNGVTSIYIGNSLDGSSIMLPPEGEYEKREIQLARLDDVCRDKQLGGPYVLKVDVQGAEILVLEGAVDVLAQCELVILEVSFFNFRPDMPDVYDVISYMKQNGFVIYEIYGGHNRPLDGARAQTDIAFVKQDGMFRNTHKWSY